METPDANASTGTSHVIPPVSNCSDCSTDSEDSATNDASSDSASVVLDESELGQFLMDTFEGLEPIELLAL